MAAITSLKDLIQKISNDDSDIFSLLGSEISLWISSVNNSTSISDLNKFIGYIYGCILSFYYGEYISGDEKNCLIIDLTNLELCREEYIISHFLEHVEEGD